MKPSSQTDGRKAGNAGFGLFMGFVASKNPDIDARETDSASFCSSDVKTEAPGPNTLEASSDPSSFIESD